MKLGNPHGEPSLLGKDPGIAARHDPDIQRDGARPQSWRDLMNGNLAFDGTPQTPTAPGKQRAGDKAAGSVSAHKDSRPIVTALGLHLHTAGIFTHRKDTFVLA